MMKYVLLTGLALEVEVSPGMGWASSASSPTLREVAVTEK